MERERQLISSGAAFEARVGYSRAVRVGDRVWVSGTAPIMPDDADEARELNHYGFLQRLRCDACRRAQLAREQEQVVERPLGAGARGTGEDGGRAVPHVREVVGERHAGPLFDERGSDLEAVVRVDASCAGP